MLEIGTRVIFQNNEYTIARHSQSYGGKLMYILQGKDGIITRRVFESSVRPVEEHQSEHSATVTQNASSAKVQPASAPTLVSLEPDKYLYLNFADNLDTGSRSWDDFYTTSLHEQYKSLKTKLGRQAPDELQEFVAGCFPLGSSTYYVSMPAFERQIKTKQKRDGTPGVAYIDNVVIRPDLSSASRRMGAKVPSQYDVIFIGNITFGTVISFTVKGIELIDSAVVKFGEARLLCSVATAFGKKTLSNGATVADYGNIDLKTPILTRDFIDSLCAEVYPIPHPEVAHRIFSQWEKYIRFRKYYLGVLSERCEEVSSVDVVKGHIVPRALFRKNEEQWTPLLLDGHPEFSRGEQIVLGRSVSGSDEFPFIRVTIDRNRHEVLSQTTGKNGRGKSKYETHLIRYTNDAMGLSSQKPQYDQEGNLPKGANFYQYILGERLAFTYADIEPDYSDLERAFIKARDEAFALIDRKYVSMIGIEAKELTDKRTPYFDEEYSRLLEEYIGQLDQTLARDIAENKDQDVRQEYANAVIIPIETPYKNKIASLAKRKAKLKANSHAEEIAAIDEEIASLMQEMQDKVKQSEAMGAIAPFYEKRNKRRIEAKRKSLSIDRQRALDTFLTSQKRQLEIQYSPSIEEEKRLAELELRNKLDASIAERRENDTIRRYQIYFHPESALTSDKDLERDLEKLSPHFLTYDNRAEKAKIERQEKALRSFLGGYVKNPYLASYLFAPETLQDASHPLAEDPDWCLTSLNDTQKMAVKHALASESIFLLQGPPGTGKTQVIAEITAQLAKRGKKVLISSETHKAIDNVFERLPKIPEIRPLRLIPSRNGKETNFSPERLVDNFYLNIQESLRRQVERFEHFNETKETFSDEMRALRLDYDRLLRLHAQNAEIDVQRKHLIASSNTISAKIEELREQLRDVAEEIDAYSRTIKYIEDYRFTAEDAKTIFMERYRHDVESLLSEFGCFVGKVPDEIGVILNADLDLLQAEIASVSADVRVAQWEAERKALQAQIGELAEEEDAFDPSTTIYMQLKDLRGKLLEVKKKIQLLQTAGGLDVTDGQLAKIVSPAVMADKELLSQLPDQIKTFKLRLSVLISSICDSILKERAFYEATESSLRVELTTQQLSLSEIKARYAEYEEEESIVEENELSSQLKQKISRFFRNFGIVREYTTTEEALDIIGEEWRTLESGYEETKASNQQKIPLFRDICRYLSSPEILEEDRQAYTRILYDNVNVFGITCTSRDRFNKTQLQELGKYGIESVDIRNQGIDVVIIDEVSKSSFLDLLIPILYGKTVILVGDHRQLPPMYDLRHMRESDFEGLDEDIITKQINDGYTALYEECFFKTLYERVPGDFRIMLDKQYRCHSHIMQVFNHFYGGASRGLSVGLKQQDDEKQHNLLVRINDNVVIDPQHHIYFVDCDQTEESTDGSTSKMNPQEADVVMTLLTGLDQAAQDLRARGGIIVDPEQRVDERPSVGVICTYGDQAGLIKRRRKGKQYPGFSGKSDEKLIISTVDDFQGDERDIIIVSMVRNPKDHRYNAEFVKQFERINVAFSRARKLLIIVGAKKFLSEQTIDLPDLDGCHHLDQHNFPVYKAIINTINYRGRLLTAQDVLGDN